MSETLVLFGAGSTGLTALRYLRDKGIEVVAFADNNPKKQTIQIDGIPVFQPEICAGKFPDAAWVVCVISRPAATELRAQLKAMGIKTRPVWECLPVCHGLPPVHAIDTIHGILGDSESEQVFFDQRRYRNSPNLDMQDPPSDIKDIYFPDFIAHREDEHYIDCGAADGDTIKEFQSRWDRYAQITAFEPDPKNMQKLQQATWMQDKMIRIEGAVSDRFQRQSFAAAGDYSSHLTLSSADTVQCYCLGELRWAQLPTYIKMDIEGSELEALWGARRILKEHSPVLAICAYHTSDHLWQIPLLIHAIQPEYRLFLRRYAEGAFEIVWYAVPPERVK
jgi:FkbM family methyltransferase